MPEILGDAVPDELSSAFWSYERALMDDDLSVLDDAFVADERALRGDASGLLIGHEQISRFRGGRGGAPRRTVREVHARRLGPDHVLLVSVNEPIAGGSGLVTQVWEHCADGRWRISAAQVAGPAPAADPRIWRVVGHPLVPPSTPGGSLNGETVAVKDLFSVAGFSVGAGNPTYLAESKSEPRHAAAVQSLLDAGAEIRGIARTDEFAYSIAGTNTHYGTPPNPRAPRRLPGGSSNGPASAVAMGHASIGLGTDTAGSIRVPASYQGLWGLRTTHGAVSAEGLLPLAPSFDTVGWLTRTPDLLTKAAEASGVGRQATSGEFVFCPALMELVDPAVREAFAARLAGWGLDPAKITGPTALAETAPQREASREAFRTVQAAEAWRTHGAWVREHPDALGPDVASRFSWAAGVTAEDERAARKVLDAVRAELDAELGDSILILPTTPTPAPPLAAAPASIDATRTATITLTCLAAITGRPAVSAPLLTVDGLPVGLSLLGPRGSDLELIDRAAALDSAEAR